MKALDLISKKELNNYIKIFSEGFETVAVLTNIDGTPITDFVYFTTLCGKYHRKYEKSAKKCIESDRKLGLEAASKKEIVINSCGCGGLVDVAIPIIINNEHIANAFTGQVLLEKPNLNEYRKLAEEFEIDDVEGYLEAVKKIKVISKKELLKIANSLKVYVEMIFNSAYEKYKNKELADYYSNLVHSLPIPTNLYSLDFKRIDVSKSSEKMLGYSVDELKDESSFIKTYSEENLKKIKEAFELAKKGQNAHVEATATRKDGTTFQMIINFAPIKNKKGEVINIVATGTDISDIKNLQEYYKSIFYYFPLPTSLCTADGKRLDFSLLAEELYRYKKEEILNLPLEKLYKEGDVSVIKEALKIASRGKAASVETVAIRKNGTTFPILLKLFPVKDKNNNIINIIVSGVDLTEIKNREEEYKKVIEETTKAMEYISSGDYNVEINTNYTQDDLQLLTGVLNEVIKYLKHSDEELQKLIKDLATPAIEVMDGVIVMPLVGRLTSDRALDAMDTILNKIEATRAKVGIIDITGVPGIDSAVADSLIKSIEAIKLVGATPILSGIGAETAKNLVRIGIKFDFVTKSNLSEALEHINKNTKT